MRVTIAFLLVAAIAVAMPQSASAALLLNANFATYANGNLVSQDGWTQVGASATLPLTVSSGTVTIPAPQAADNQDAYKNNSVGVILPPVSGTTSTYVGLDLKVNSAPAIGSPGFASPSYFAAIYNGTNGTGFANWRLSAVDNSAVTPGTYRLAARITGQAGNPFTFGAPLNYGTDYNVVLRTDMVAGAGNDFYEVFVNGVSNLTNSIGTGTDPTGVGSFVLSQFGNATVGVVGATIGRVRMADNFAQAAAPEPTSLLLFAVTALGFASAARLRRQER
jgi:hypothetical protein